MSPNVKHGTEIGLSLEDIGLRHLKLHVPATVDHHDHEYL